MTTSCSSPPCWTTVFTNFSAVDYLLPVFVGGFAFSLYLAAPGAVVYCFLQHLSGGQRVSRASAANFVGFFAIVIVPAEVVISQCGILVQIVARGE